MATSAPSAQEPRPQRADARRNRERLVVAAREAFAEAGRDVQMPDIAKAAGVGVGTLYRHFPTKEDLVLALVRDKVQTVIEHAREALTHPDPGESVEWLVRRGAAHMSRSRGLRDAMSTIDLGDENPWHTADTRTHVEAVLSRAREAKAIRADLTVDDWHGLMCGLSAAIAGGADPDRQAELILSAIRR